MGNRSSSITFVKSHVVTRTSYLSPSRRDNQVAGNLGLIDLQMKATSLPTTMRGSRATARKYQWLHNLIRLGPTGRSSIINRHPTPRRTRPLADTCSGGSERTKHHGT